MFAGLIKKFIKIITFFLYFYYYLKKEKPYAVIFM